MERREGKSSLASRHSRCKGTEVGTYLAASKDCKEAGGVEADEQRGMEGKKDEVVARTMKGLGDQEEPQWV